MDSIRVLHVDDEPSFGRLVADFLERTDDAIEVVTESNADDGISRIEAPEEDVDCVVSDYDMPGLDGLEFLEAVRADHPDLPFILYTGKGSETVAGEAISKGATDYLQKDSGTEQYELLANRVRNAVEQHRSTRAAERTRRRLAHLAESTSDCVWMFDRDWEELLFISGYENVWDRPAEAIRENPTDFLQGVDPEDRAFVRDAMARLSEGESIDIEYRIRRGEDDERGWVSVRGAPVIDDDGRVESVVGFTRDITERKRREQRLERYARIVENLPVGVFRTTPDGEFVDVNERYASLVGAASPDDLAGASAREFWADPDDREALLRRLERDGVVENLAVEIETRGGDTRWVETTLRITREDGQRYLDGIARDVTERRSRRRRLERAETMFENAQDALFLIDVDETFTVERVNPAYEAATGLSNESLAGRTPREILGEEDGARVERKYRECVETRTSREYEETLSIDGERTHWETRIAPVVIDGDVEKIVGATRDISDRVERKRQLREERNFIEQCLDALEDIFYVFDADGEILRWNEQLSAVTGYTDEEIAEMEPMDFFPDEQREQIAEAVQTAIETGSVTVQADYQTKDGERIPYEFTGYRLTDADGDVLGFAGIGRDLTRQREYERQLERRNERLEEFTSIVSHDLRNPLNVATSRLQLAREECDSPQLEHVDSALDRMESLLEDLLTLAREGETATSLEPVELAGTVRRCWTNVETGDAELVVDTDRTIRADESRLKQVFENLVGNAVQHAGPDVTVTVGDIDGGFYVADDGPGIPEPDREDVFEAGYSTSESGTGFGLSIVEQVAESHGWDIEVVDGATGGARFEITGVDVV